MVTLKSCWSAPAVTMVVFAGMSLASPQPAGAQRVPVIERIEPTSGPPGTVLYVVGRNFSRDVRVSVGGVSLEVERRLPSRVTVRVSEAVTGGFVVVTTARGTAQGPSFRITASLPAPVIEGMAPATGPPGSRVTLTGKNFSPRLGHNRVSLGGKSVLVYSASPVSLVVTVPAGAISGAFKVVVSNAGEASSGPFEVAAGTRVAGVEPKRAVPGGSLAILGAGFSTTPKDNRVFLNDGALVVTEASAQRLVVKLPRDISPGVLLVDVKGAGRAQLAASLRVQRMPSIDSLDPVMGPAGTIVTVTGGHFGDDVALVKAAIGKHAVTVRSVEPTRLTFEVPADARTGRLSVTVSGVGPARSAEPFGVQLPPVVGRFSPRSGPVGTVVVIHGSGFAGSAARNRVTIGDVVVEVLRASRSRLKVRIPHAASGLLTVEAIGVGAGRTTDPFVVTVPPKISSFEPTATTVGTEVTLHGSGFGDLRGGVTVTLGDRKLRVKSVSDDTLVVRIPRGVKTGRLVVKVPLEGSARTREPLTVLENLVAGAVRPRRAAPGQLLRIAGRGFIAGQTRVEFSGGVGADARVIDPRSLEVVLPAGAESGLMTVTLKDGRSSVTRGELKLLAPTPPPVAPAALAAPTVE